MKVNIVNGENAMYCNYCKKCSDTTYSTLIATGPEVLIIILNRGKGNEFNINLTFYQELSLKNYIEIKETGYLYDLFGIIMRLKGSHNIAYCKSYWDNQWLKYNDAIVTPVNDFIKEVIDAKMPNVLFYKKKKSNI